MLNQNRLDQHAVSFKTLAPAICIVLFIFCGLFCLLLLDILNEDWQTAFLYAALAWLPISIIGLLYWRRQLQLWTQDGWLRPWFLMIVGFGLMMLSTAPYVFLLNAVSAGESTYLLAGKFVGKQESHGKSTSHTLIINDLNKSDKVSFRVSKEDYDSMATGDNYQRCMRVGGLGMLFNWRNGVAPLCSKTSQ